MNAEKFDRLAERLKQPGPERMKALNKLKQFARTDIPLIFDLKFDELLIAIVQDKLTPANELQNCLSVFMTLVFSREQKKTFVDKGILPALVARCALDHEPRPTVALAAGTLYSLRLSAEETVAQWIAAQVPKRLFELLAADEQISGIASSTLWTLSNIEVFGPALTDGGFLAYLISTLNIGALQPQHFATTTKQKKALSILCNLAMWEPCRPQLAASGAVDVLSPLMKWEGYAGVRSTMGLAYLVGSKEDKASKLLVAQPAVIERLIRLLDTTIHGQDSGFNTIFSEEEVLLAIQLLTISDNNKALLGTDETIKHLLEILTKRTGSERTLELTSAALFELSFDAEVMRRLKDPKHDIVAVLEPAAAALKNKAQHNVKQLLWALEDHKHSSRENLASTTAARPAGHVMMSYSWAHQPIVVRLARALQKSGLQVWLDVDAMQGSTADAMAQAVEDAAVLIVTVSEKYKESSNCRLEAQYALQLNKPVVYLMMQKGYKPTGWLGLMMGAKLYYDMSDDSLFAERLEAIKRELSTILGPSAGSAAAAGPRATSGGTGIITASRSLDLSSVPPPASETPSLVHNMTESDVESWLQSSNLGSLTGAFRTHAVDGLALSVLWSLHERDGPAACLCVLRRDFEIAQMGLALRFLHHLRQLCIRQ